VARLEGRVVLEEILARFPGYGVEASRCLQRRADQGLVSVPIRLRAEWDCGGLASLPARPLADVA
jgi:hypothetical protein